MQGPVTLWLLSCLLPEVVSRILNPSDNDIPNLEPTVVHKWTTIDYVIPQNMSYHNFRMTYPYDYRNTVLGGIKTYNGEIYVTIPRISPGVSATLTRIVEKDGETRLDAFPNWDWNVIGDCSALQSVNNIEVDPERGWMWIADYGRVNTFHGGLRNLCPAKLIILDLNTLQVVARHVFSEQVSSIRDAFFSDIVIHPEAGYAFMPSTVEAKLIFFSLHDNFSISVSHPLFKFERGNNSIIVQNRRMELAPVSAHIYSLAMSPRRDYILYSHLGGYGVYKIDMEFFTNLIENPEYVSEVGQHITRVGYKSAQSACLLMGQNNLYYGALGKEAVYDWQVDDVLSYPDVPQDVLKHVQQEELVADDRMYWVNKISLDSEGVMWITSSNLVRYFLDVMDYHNTYNYFIWKVQIGDSSYLQKKTSPLQTTTPTPTTTTASPTSTHLSSITVELSDAGTNTASLKRMDMILITARLLYATLAVIAN